MDLENTLAQLRQVISPVLEEDGVLLVEMNLLAQGARLTLRLLVDRKEGGISLGDCARLNTKIGQMLDESNMFEDRYILEVSSPGVDRPLKTSADYARCKNRKVRFFLNEPINGKIEIEGQIKEVTGESVSVETNAGRLEILLAKVARAKQVIG